MKRTSSTAAIGLLALTIGANATTATFAQTRTNTAPDQTAQGVKIIGSGVDNGDDGETNDDQGSDDGGNGSDGDGESNDGGN